MAKAVIESSKGTTYIGNKAALWHQRCPRCHTGHVFKHATYNLKFYKMHEHCPVCSFKFEIEPGFFWGAMYISYGFAIILGVIGGAFAYYVFHDPDVWTYMACIMVLLIIFAPLNFRYSRLFMLYWFASVNFDPNTIK